MTWDQIGPPLLGGILIGISASMLLLLKGRVFGISGILAGVLLPKQGEISWRIAILLGLLTSGVVFYFIKPEALVGDVSKMPWRYILAGLFVGFGTQLGSGCTSGHGVCGISRFSKRSIVATLVFMVAGAMMVAALRFMGVDL